MGMNLREELFKALSETDIMLKDIEIAADMPRNTIYNIVKRGNGRFNTVQKIFNALGYEIKVIKHENKMDRP